MQTLLILGITGSLGHALIHKYKDTHNIVGFSRDENKQWLLKLKYPQIKFHLGDIRDINKVRSTVQLIKPDIIIICSALKHIDICEYNIEECVKTNIYGIQNIVTVCLEHPENLHSVLFISTDKACSPINVYGASKSISERIMVEASTKSSSIKFLCVRYGNVINSRGSLIPKYQDIAKNENDKYFPVTDIAMTRFFLTLEKSVKLIDITLNYGVSGDTWIPVVESCYIHSIAKWFSDKFKKPIKITGIRPGEKMHESLINSVEMYRTIVKTINQDTYYVIKPCYENYNLKEITQEYSSDKCISLSVQELME